MFQIRKITEADEAWRTARMLREKLMRQIEELEVGQVMEIDPKGVYGGIDYHNAARAAAHRVNKKRGTFKKSKLVTRCKKEDNYVLKVLHVLIQA